ncbi:CRAL/TRIO domain-containing protein [Auriculariales sp. MPI-PUGE-AT-0066]|nr:CRAL/TRIO domain-containing protein [Auriculariales sp. MPI-PUGE-AT-0066]
MAAVMVESSTTPTRVPHSPPSLPTGAPRPSSAYANLSTNEQAKHDRLPLDDAEKFWLSEECIQRFVRASKGIEGTAKTRLEATLRWRREYGFGTQAMSAEALAREGETGKIMIFGYDHARRPGIYLWPSRENTEEPDGQIRFVCFMMETAFTLFGPGVETVALFVNYADKAKHGGIGNAKTFLQILQAHYPERLGAAYIVQIPFFTRTKMHINPNMVADELVAADELMTMAHWGGGVNFEYDHAVYWPELMKLSHDRREIEFAEWSAMGSKIGTSEWDLKRRAYGNYASTSSAEALLPDTQKT